MNGIRTIISDADGTLIDTMDLIRHGQYEAVATYLEQRERSKLVTSQPTQILRRYYTRPSAAVPV
jgi:phosphoglycolate phosphatase-like HAD superfamily hydrolase